MPNILVKNNNDYNHIYHHDNIKKEEEEESLFSSEQARSMSCTVNITNRQTANQERQLPVHGRHNCKHELTG